MLTWSSRIVVLVSQGLGRGIGSRFNSDTFVAGHSVSKHRRNCCCGCCLLSIVVDCCSLLAVVVQLTPGVLIGR